MFFCVERFLQFLESLHESAPPKTVCYYLRDQVVVSIINKQQVTSGIDPSMCDDDEHEEAAYN